MKRSSKKKREITMDDLALMVQGGFKEVDGKFKEVYEKMDSGFKEVNGKFEEVYKRFDKVDNRLDIIELKLIARHEREIEQLRDRILKIEVKLAKR